MECKFFALLLCYSLGDELIDTLWNVNLEAAADIKEWLHELIDTLWNVNSL